MTKYILKIAAGILLMTGVGSAIAQQVDRNDMSQPTPGEIAMATDCRDTYQRMRAVEKLLDRNRNEMTALDIKAKKAGQTLDELEAIFKENSGKSEQSEEAYQKALLAKQEYEKAATTYNKLIDQQDKVSKRRTALSDEFYVLNPDYVGKCSGTIFKALSVILTCKDEQSEWCDLLK